jgi:hypothetical protein
MNTASANFNGREHRMVTRSMTRPPRAQEPWIFNAAAWNAAVDRERAQDRVYALFAVLAVGVLCIGSMVWSISTSHSL